MNAHARSNLLAVLLRLALFAFAGLRAFVPPQQPLRGASAAAAVAAASAALPAGAADEYLNYNMTGEYTPFMIIGYFGLTTFLTAFAFGSLALFAFAGLRAFVPPQQPLRGASAPLRWARERRMSEYTPFMIIGYFGLTTFLTAFAFGSYLILTKLKII
ncbi:unnamed protein product [Effrenium voratum]|nr:unnamed protein product [Effrenium voratum]